LEDRIRAHILISWLRIIEVKTDATWPKLRNELDRLHLGHFSSKNGDLYQTTRLTPKQRETFVSIGAEPPPKVLEIQPKA